MTTRHSAMPPAMILCGGKGTRLREVTELLPKPMVPIGEQPILWHIMRGYAAFGVTRFLLCLGYKREMFIDYFLNFRARSGDMTIRLGSEESITYHQNSMPEKDWEVTLIDTGVETMTGGRVRSALRYLQSEDERFFLTYGDGVADINMSELLDFHRREGKGLTISAVHPEGRFGELGLDGPRVRTFAEKPAHIEGYINGGFMVVEKKLIETYLPPEEPDCFFEQYPMNRAYREGEMTAWRHEGFWQCMDTPREHQFLNDLWRKGNAPWARHWK